MLRKRSRLAELEARFPRQQASMHFKARVQHLIGVVQYGFLEVIQPFLCTKIEARVAQISRKFFGAFFVVACLYRTGPYSRDLGTIFKAVFAAVLTIQGHTICTVGWHVFQGCLALKLKWTVGTFF